MAPKVARVAGRGIVKIAQASGCPIYPIAVATNHRIVMNNWDRTTVNLPFSRALTDNISANFNYGITYMPHARTRHFLRQCKIAINPARRSHAQVIRHTGNDRILKTRNVPAIYILKNIRHPSAIINRLADKR